MKRRRWKSKAPRRRTKPYWRNPAYREAYEEELILADGRKLALKGSLVSPTTLMDLTPGRYNKPMLVKALVRMSKAKLLTRGSTRKVMRASWGQRMEVTYQLREAERVRRASWAA